MHACMFRVNVDRRTGMCVCVHARVRACVCSLYGSMCKIHTNVHVCACMHICVCHCVCVTLCVCVCVCVCLTVPCNQEARSLENFDSCHGFIEIDTIM